LKRLNSNPYSYVHRGPCGCFDYEMSVPLGNTYILYVREGGYKRLKTDVANASGIEVLSVRWTAESATSYRVTVDVKTELDNVIVHRKLANALDNLGLGRIDRYGYNSADKIFTYLYLVDEEN
jgi:hypothetical protein